tara:strand:- start:15 stop:281 length:267 start_codon:yes stop_codon:yes gene_type:complete
MFKPQDFEIPLEKQLKMRVIYDEVEGCKDIEVLQASLKSTVEQLMKYQHLLSITLQKQIESELKSFDKELKELILKEFTEEIDKIDPG